MRGGSCLSELLVQSIARSLNRYVISAMNASRPKGDGWSCWTSSTGIGSVRAFAPRAAFGVPAITDCRMGPRRRDDEWGEGCDGGEWGEGVAMGASGAHQRKPITGQGRGL